MDLQQISGSTQLPEVCWGETPSPHYDKEYRGQTSGLAGEIRSDLCGVKKGFLRLEIAMWQERAYYEGNSKNAMGEGQMRGPAWAIL